MSRALNGLPAVHCARPSSRGNPFKIGDICDFGNGKFTIGSRLHAQTMYRDHVIRFHLQIAAYAKRQPTPGRGGIAAQKWVADLLALRGNNLACWCPLNEPCHADLLLRLANDLSFETNLRWLAP